MLSQSHQEAGKDQLLQVLVIDKLLRLCRLHRALGKEPVSGTSSMINDLNLCQSPRSGKVQESGVFLIENDVISNREFRLDGSVPVNHTQSNRKESILIQLDREVGKDQTSHPLMILKEFILVQPDRESGRLF